MAREKLKDFLNRNYESTGADRIDYVIDGTGVYCGEDGKVMSKDDLGIDPNTGAALLDFESGDSVIGDWVADIQANADVLFNLAPGTQEAYSAIRGNTLQAADTMGAQRVFVRTTDAASTADPIPMAISDLPIDTSHLATTLYSWSNSGKFDDSYDASTGANDSPQTLGNFLDKTTGADGHYLLASIKGKSANYTGGIFVDTDNDLISDAVRTSLSILSTYNRYQPNGPAGTPEAPSSTGTSFTNPIGGENNSVSDIETFPYATSQMKFGKHLRHDQVDSSYSGPMKFSSMKEIAASIMLNAMPADAQSRVSRDDYYASQNENAPQTSAGVSTRASAGIIADSPEDDSPFFPLNQSVGTTNHPDFMAKSEDTTAIAQAAVIVLKAAAGSISEIVQGLVSSTPTMILGRGPLLLGGSALYKDAKARHLMSSLFVPTTERTWVQCVDFGSACLFGQDFTSDTSEPGPDKSPLGDSPIFFRSLASSIVRSIEAFESIVENASTFDGYNDGRLSNIASSGVVGLMNALASIGNVGFIRNKGNNAAGERVAKAAKGVGPFDVDKMADGPSTRVGKSRTQDGFTQQALSMRTSATPSLYMLPRNIIRASMQLGTLGIGTNPMRGMMASSLGNKTYIDQAMDNEAARIPNDIVERMENVLDAEYVPFYFHDLRTNEIVAFHAFLETLTDTFNANYSETKGYGRIDPVQTYKDTTRSVGFSFYVAATSQEDFDEMWFKINKLVTLCYPQWTKGTSVNAKQGDKTQKFIQPFSQVMGATPLIRLRIGDVIKSNYSKFHLARMFGIGNSDAGGDVSIEDPEAGFADSAFAGAQRAAWAVTEQIFYIAYGSPMAWITADDPGVARALRGAVGNLLTNGFANPLLILYLRHLRDPDAAINSAPYNMTLGAAAENLLGPSGEAATMLQGSEGNGFGYSKLFIVWLKPTMGKAYINADGDEFRFIRPIKCMVMNKEVISLSDINSGYDSPGMSGARSYTVRGSARKTIYTVAVIDTSVPVGEEGMFFKNFKVVHSDLIADPTMIFNLYVMLPLDPLGALTTVAQAIVNEVAVAAGVPVDTIQLFQSAEAKFMSANKNAITRSFNMMKGRGLAGVLSQLDFTWYDGVNTWETDWNSRAPKVAKVTCKFEPIHDLPPGIAHDGFNRAPIYNVGRIMDTVAGDVYDDNGAASRSAYGSDARKAFRKVGKKGE